MSVLWHPAAQGLVQAAAVTKDDFVRLSREMKGETHLLEQNAENLWGQFQENLSVVVVFEGRIVAHVTLWPLSDGWFELGTLWVDKTHRQHGLGHIVCREVLTKRESILLTTTNPVVWQISEDIGMRHVSFRDLPPHVHHATCVCPPKKIEGATNQMLCPLKDKVCRVYVK